MSRLDDIKNELSATIQYAEQLGEKLKSADLSKAERMDTTAELEATGEKAEGLSRDLKEEEKTQAREYRIREIGRENRVEAPADEEVPVYNNPLDMLFDSPEMKARLGGENSKTRDERFDTGVIEFKVPVDPQDANPGDLVQNLRPGIVAPFVYPRRIGPLFAQSGMSGSKVAWLKLVDPDGGADYVDYGGQKPDGSTTLDIDDVKAAKIATTFTVPDDALDDVPALRGTLSQMLLVGPNGVDQKAEIEYIAGSGTGTPVEIAGIDSLSPEDFGGTGDNPVKDVVAAALDIEAETGFPATAAAINPASVGDIMFLEPASGDGRPLFSPFGGGYQLPTIGFPWVVTKAVAAGKIYVGAWNTSILYTRMATNIRATSEGIGLADKNLTMFVAETRQALVHPYGGDTYRVVNSTS